MCTLSFFCVTMIRYRVVAVPLLPAEAVLRGTVACSQGDGRLPCGRGARLGSDHYARSVRCVGAREMPPAPGWRRREEGAP